MNERNDDAELDRRLARTPLAVVGISSLFPGSSDVEGFWNGIVDRVDSIRDIPEWHWDVADHYSADRSAPDKTYAKRGGFIDPVPFHPIEFGIPPAQLDVTDVLQLLSLVVTRDVLEDARAEGSGWFDRERTGIVLGVTGANQLTQPLSARLQTPAVRRAARSIGLSEADADELARRFSAGFAPWEENSFPGMLGNVVAGRVANRFDLGGMNMTVDAACASSLGALRAAAAELVDHRADTMITGGCDAENTIFMYLCFSKTPAFSPTGDVRPFDASSDGTLIGEGIGMLALRRLEDAERDGNRIYSVIRGIGSASDGRYKSIYAPRASGQQLALRRAYDDADCSPASVSIIEAHGTGTAVGDATELSALSEVLAQSGAAESSIGIGSVKSQIGHTKAAAGAAGLIKLSLALQHRILPPTIKVEQPADSFTGSPLHVSTRTRPWFRTPERPVRRAGLSAFGFGGTNFHVVLEEHPRSRELGNVLDRSTVWLWTAPTAEELAAALEAGAAPTPSGTALDADAPRIAVVAVTEAERDALLPAAARRLREAPGTAWSDPRGIHHRPAALGGGVGILFSGQGSQHVDAGLGAVLREPLLMDALEEAYAIPGLEHLAALAYPPPPADAAAAAEAERALRATENAQPAIGALSAAHHLLLGERGLGLAASGFVGHSFGELTALWAAGSYDHGTFLTLARERGRAMAEAASAHGDAGSMAAVLADRETVDRLLAASEGVLLCNANSPRQHVVGGPVAAVAGLVRRAEADGIRVVELPVSAAFHTPAVADAVGAFGQAVRSHGVGAPARGTVYANTAGAEYGADAEANARILADQLARPVDFERAVRRMHDDGIRILVECGPGNVLGRLATSILADDADVLVVSADGGDPETSAQALATAVAQLAVAGALPRWRSAGLRARPAARPGKGPAVMLAGVNHVSADRAAAYEELLATPYALRTDAPHEQDATPAPLRASTPVDDPASPRPRAELVPTTPLPYLPRSESPTMSSTTAPTATVTRTAPVTADQLDLAKEQLHVHAAFLSGQQNVSESLLAMLDGGAGRLSVDGMREIVAQCIAVGDAHVQVNRLITGLGDGGAAPSHGLPAARDGGALLARPRMEAPAAPAGPHPVPASAATATPSPAAAPAPAPAPAPTPMPTPAPAPAPAPAAADPAAEVDVDALVREIVAEKTGYSADILESDMGIEADLGIDSIKRVEILGAIGERFPGRAPFSPEEVAELRTLGDIVEALRGQTTGTSRERRASAAADDEEAAPGIRRSTVRWAPIAGPDLPTTGVPRVVRVRDASASGIAPRLRDELRAAGHDVRIDGDGDDAGRADDDADLVLVVGPRPDADATETLVEALDAVRGFARAVADRAAAAADSGADDAGAAPQLLAVGLVDDRDGTDARGVAAAGLAGLVRTLRIEHPGIRARALLLEDGADDPAAALIAWELDDTADGLDTVRWRDGRREAPVVEPEAPAHDAGASGRTGYADLGSDDLVLVTGGAQGITARCIRDLAAAHPGPGLVLVGRTPLEDEEGWSRGLADEADLRAAATEHLRGTDRRPTPRSVGALVASVAARRQVRDQLALLRAGGAEVHYASVDLTDRDATARALAPFADRIAGIVHGTGAIADRLLVDKTPEDATRVVATKIRSLENAIAALGGTARLRHVALFASVAGLFGNRGQSDYAMANAVLDRWAEALADRLPDAHVVAIDWGAWEGGMVSDAVRELFRSRGYALVGQDDGARLFVEQLGSARTGQAHVLLGPAEPLSGDPVPLRPTRSAQPLGELLDSELVHAHALEGRRILPTAAAVCLLAGAAIRHTGRGIARMEDIRVTAGIEEGSGSSFAVSLSAGPVTADGSPTVRAVLASVGDGPAGADRPRFTATFASGSAASPLPAGSAAPAGPVPPLRPIDPYASGLLFHGDALRAVTGIARDGADVIVGAVDPAVPRPAETRGAGPVDAATLDVLLQAALVAAHEATGMRTLPSAIGTLRWTGEASPGDPLTIRATRIEEQPDGVRMDLEARTGDRVLALLDGVVVTRRPEPVAEAAAAAASATTAEIHAASLTTAIRA